MSEKPFRLLPQLTPENWHYWTAGARGELCFLRCQACKRFVHPPMPICGACLGRELLPAASSGRARLLTYTVNHHPWVPGFDPPYIIAIVALEEQPDLRITTNLVNCPQERIQIGMAVRACFEEREDGIFLPLFEPAEA